MSENSESSNTYSNVCYIVNQFVFTATFWKPQKPVGRQRPKLNHCIFMITCHYQICLALLSKWLSKFSLCT
jgi:hypothetical protein